MLSHPLVHLTIDLRKTMVPKIKKIDKIAEQNNSNII